MKFRSQALAITAALFFLLSFLSPVFSMDEPVFIIKRMVVCESISDKEPVGIKDTFSGPIEKVYCFLEAGQIEQVTTVTFVWYFEGEEMARVALPLEKGYRWRTYASKKISGLKGNWTVDLLEASGIVLNTVNFQVQ
jgi:hypothetical protein